ncbi:MAG TPA: hypothetical protein VF732_06610 [Nitrospira sp.]
MLTAVETSQHNSVNNSSQTDSSQAEARKQRVTITLPLALLERLRNAVYWTGHGPLARLIADALDDAVSDMEQANGQPFPQRLSPLKRGRPRTKSRASLPIAKIQSA